MEPSCRYEVSLTEDGPGRACGAAYIQWSDGDGLVYRHSRL
jgi:hypothetical protein